MNRLKIPLFYSYNETIRRCDKTRTGNTSAAQASKPAPRTGKATRKKGENMLNTGFIESLAEYAEEHRNELSNNEEATKHSLVLRFIQGLGYNIFDVKEVDPEFTADIGMKRGEKVDYAIKCDGEAIALIECKALNVSLDRHVSQLHRYFGVVTAQIGVLTNGVEYKFYSDLDNDNVMDYTPFLEVDFRDVSDGDIEALNQFARGAFDVISIKENAIESGILSVVKANLEQMSREPDDEFSRVMLRGAVEGRLTKRLLAQHSEVIKRAIAEFAMGYAVRLTGGENVEDVGVTIAEAVAEDMPIVPAAMVHQDEVGALAPTAEPVAREWHSLADIDVDGIANRPNIVRFPDGETEEFRAGWPAALGAIGKWLADNGHLGIAHCPQTLGRRYLIAEEAVHPNGADFRAPKDMGEFQLESRWNPPYIVSGAKLLIEISGLDAADFEVFC